jgi:chorismate dehydratase
MVQKSRVRIGAVSFLNTKPLIYSLLHPTPLNEEIELSVHVPSRLAELLNADSIDVGLIPIIEYFRVAGQANLRPYRIIPHISISSRGAVRSIQLFSRVPIPEIQSVGLDTSSRSSRALLRIVFAEKYDLHPTFSASPPSIDLQSAETDAVLRIGDAALRRLGSTPYALDLGAEWDELTGLPFVYACWVARGEVDFGRVAQILQEAKRLSIRQIPEIARLEAGALGLPEELCSDYLTNRISYDLGDSEIAGICRFYELAQKHDLAPPGVSLRFA